MISGSFSFSYWEKEHLLGRPDFAVIGGGITGLTTAFFLKKRFPNRDVALFERAEWSAGASTRNAGFACFGSLSELLDDHESMSPNEVFSLVERRWRGLRMLRELVGDEKMDFRPCGGVELFTESEPDSYLRCLDFMPEANRNLQEIIGQDVFGPKENSFGFGDVKRAILNRFEGKLNTGKMYASLVQLAREAGVRLFFGCCITDIREELNRVELRTAHGDFHAGAAIVCTNGFARQILPELEVRPARNLVLVGKHSGFQANEVFHFDKGYIYFREVNGRLLLGGARNADPETEMTDSYDINELILERLNDFARRVIHPGREPEWEYQWTGIMGIGPKKSPLIGQSGPRLYHAVRLGGMGVALGTLIGKETADLIQEP